MGLRRRRLGVIHRFGDGALSPHAMITGRSSPVREAKLGATSAMNIRRDRGRLSETDLAACTMMLRHRSPLSRCNRAARAVTFFRSSHGVLEVP